MPTAALAVRPAESGTPTGELILPLALVAVVVIMVIPLPSLLIDLLLALSISLALLILMVSIYARRPLEFSTFPSVLLVVTLFRLGLNVASTRLILLRGHEGPAAAGHVIQAFGNFVVGGSYVVGFVVFLILVVINFAVITKGAGRIAEVAARFTLDAMPGKQLAIDADLNSGLINETDARARRREIEAEADFYGAMDGASKFVRGDAVADKPEALLALDLMELEVGFELVPLVGPAAGGAAPPGGDLVERIRTLRRQLALEMGFIVPPIHIRDNLQIKPSEYVILVKGNEVARGEVR